MIDPTVEPDADGRRTGRFEALVGAPITPPSPIPRDAQPFQGHRAGIVTRFIADAIDFGVLILALIAIYCVVATGDFLLDPRTFTFPQPPFGLVFLVGAVVLWLYLTAAWWLTG